MKRTFDKEDYFKGFISLILYAIFGAAFLFFLFPIIKLGDLYRWSKS